MKSSSSSSSGSGKGSGSGSGSRISTTYSEISVLWQMVMFFQIVLI